MSERRERENTNDKSAPNIREQAAMPQSYEHILEVVIRLIRGFSAFIDKTLFNPHYSRLVALVLAVFMYIVVNFATGTRISTMNYSRDMAGISVTAKYNSDTFELSGLPA